MRSSMFWQLLSRCAPPMAAVSLALAVPAPAAHAQDEAPPEGTSEAPSDAPAAESDGDKDYRFELGLFGGGHFFTSDHGLGRDEGDSEDLSPHHNITFGARLTFNFNPYIGLEAEGGLTPTFTRDDEARLWLFGYRGSLIVNFVPSGPFRPFLNVGYGGMTMVVDRDGGGTLPIPYDDTDGFFHAGLGAKIFFGQSAGLRLDGRVMLPPAFASPVVEIGNETEFGGPDWQILGSLFFGFGEIEKPKREIQVQKEVVVVQPPPPPENPDPDGDGIAGENDKCKNVAEDRDGFEDEDGCPDNDNDNDGLPDAQDKCPLKAEVVNSIDDEDGCPEEDADNDGFLGSRDQCPDAPETKNNFKDDDGCPDEVPTEIKKFTGVIQGINFKTGSAEILPGSFVILDRAVKVLQDFPDVNLEVSGHTDSRGSADRNRDLSQRRAESVKQYFVNRGVEAKRLQAVGYGEDRPIADNTSEAGRGRNRRTEFNLISQ